jgi:quaternary ammonium compound-resistance protein SugE
MAWLYVIGASMVEIGIFTLVKLYGFTRLWPGALIAVLSLGIPFIMQFALKTLPMGTAYAAFVGMAMVGNVLIGIAFFQESASMQRLLFVGLIVAGVIGLRLIENPSAG